jgi:hypothetical protein
VLAQVVALTENEHWDSLLCLCENNGLVTPPAIVPLRRVRQIEEVQDEPEGRANPERDRSDSSNSGEDEAER